MMESVMAGAIPGEEVVGEVEPGDDASNASAVSSEAENEKRDLFSIAQQGRLKNKETVRA